MERNTVVCADALEWLRGLPSGSVDCFWSSPEYNLDDPFRSGGNSARRERDSYAYRVGTGKGDGNAKDEDVYQAEQLAVLTEWHRVLADDGVAFYNHKVRIKRGRAISPLSWILRSPLVLFQEVVWDRGGTPQVNTCRYLPVSERVYVLTKRPHLKLDNRSRLPDVWRFPKDHHNRRATGHPCPTHPGVVEASLQVVPRADGRRPLVADCYAGSGTTARVARRLGMDYLLCDHTPEYVALIQASLTVPWQPVLELTRAS